MGKYKFDKSDLQALITDGQVPALPNTAIQLLDLANDPTKGPDEIAVPITADPGLTGQVLRFVNSSYFGFSHEIATVPRAISLVGVHTIKNFALWSAVFSLMPEPGVTDFDLKTLWQDSLRRAIFAKAVARRIESKDPELAFSAALLQDLAIPLVMKAKDDVYGLILNARADGKRRLSLLEKHAFGMDHAEMGGVVARFWNLPNSFTELIESHVDIEQWATRAREFPNRAAIALSALLPSGADSEWFEYEAFLEYGAKILPSKDRPIDEMLAETDRQFVEFAPVLQMNVSIRSLAECCQQAVDHKSSTALAT